MEWAVIKDICISIAVVGAAVAYIYKAFKFVKKPADDVKDNIKGNQTKIIANENKIKDIDDTLQYLVNANNLVIRSLFTVLGELAVNNDSDGKIKKAQDEIHNFLTPVNNTHNVV